MEGEHYDDDDGIRMHISEYMPNIMLFHLTHTLPLWSCGGLRCTRLPNLQLFNQSSVEPSFG